jgi:hypothetical protein
MSYPLDNLEQLTLTQLLLVSFSPAATMPIVSSCRKLFLAKLNTAVLGRNGVIVAFKLPAAPLSLEITSDALIINNRFVEISRTNAIDISQLTCKPRSLLWNRMNTEQESDLFLRCHR